MGEGRGGGWTEHASYRTLQTWKQFTVMPGAEQDASFATIKNVVAYLSETDERSSTGQAGGVSGQTTADNKAPKRSSRRQKTVKKSRRKKSKSKSRKNRQNK